MPLRPAVSRQLSVWLFVRLSFSQKLSSASFGGRGRLRPQAPVSSSACPAMQPSVELAKLTQGGLCLGFYPVSLDSRKLGTAGQKLGGAAVLCHIKHDPVDPGGSFTLTSANVGKCQTVLCRNGKPLPLSRSYVMSCEEELKRIKRHKAIITEVRRESCFLRVVEKAGPGLWQSPAGEHSSSKNVLPSWFKIKIPNP